MARKKKHDDEEDGLRRTKSGKIIFPHMRPAHERAKRAAATRRDRELTDRQDRRWSQWDYIEEPIDDIGGEDGDTPDFP